MFDSFGACSVPPKANLAVLIVADRLHLTYMVPMAFLLACLACLGILLPLKRSAPSLLMSSFGFFATHMWLFVQVGHAVYNRHKGTAKYLLYMG